MARRTQAQLAETRQAIIAAGKQVFAEKGFARTQVAEIAQQAGVGMSAFYGQFSDKSELFLLIIMEVFNELHTGVLQVRRGLLAHEQGQDAQAQDGSMSNQPRWMSMRQPEQAVLIVQQIYELVFTTLEKHSEIILSAFRSGYSAIPGLEALYWQICDAVAAELSRDFTQGEAAGVLNVISHRDMSDGMIGMMQHLGYRMVLQGSPTPVEAARMCTQYTLGSLLMSMPREKLLEVVPLWAARSA